MRVVAPDAPLLTVLRDYAEAREEAFERARRNLDMNDLDARALLYICENPGARPSAIAHHLAVKGAAATTLLDRLAARGLVERRVGGTDPRSLHVFATREAEVGPLVELCAFDDDIEAASAVEPRSGQEVAAAVIGRLLGRR